MQAGRPKVLLPEVLGERPQVQGLILSLRVPEDLAYFQGHFDAAAVVPGVVQVHWAAHFAKQRLGLERVFSHMEVVKFKELLLPRQRLELDLRYFAEACKLDFRYSSQTAEYSSGRLYFHGEQNSV